MDGYEWLGLWEPLEAPGKHCKMYPALFAHGYQYDPHVFRQRGVSRAVPVDGRVGPSWERSPQVKRWMEKEKPTILTLIVSMLRAWRLAINMWHQ